MFNEVILIGNLTRDIELKYIPSGAAIAKGGIATSYKYKTQTGEQKEEVCFLDFNVFGKQSEILNKYVRKGSKVLLTGRLVFEQWTAQDGTNRSRHSLRVENFKFLDSKSDNQGHNAPNQEMENNQQYHQNVQSGSDMSGYNRSSNQDMQNNKYPEIDIDNDEIPF